MPLDQRKRILARIAEIRQMLCHADSQDVRATLAKALADCEQHLVELDSLDSRVRARRR